MVESDEDQVRRVLRAIKDVVGDATAWQGTGMRIRLRDATGYPPAMISKCLKPLVELQIISIVPLKPSGGRGYPELEWKILRPRAVPYREGEQWKLK